MRESYAGFFWQSTAKICLSKLKMGCKMNHHAVIWQKLSDAFGSSRGMPNACCDYGVGECFFFAVRGASRGLICFITHIV